MDRTISVQRKQIQILVQGNDQVTLQFTQSVNEWLSNQENDTVLDKAVCASNGRITLVFSWDEDVRISVKPKRYDPYKKYNEGDRILTEENIVLTFKITIFTDKNWPDKYWWSDDKGEEYAFDKHQ